MFFVGDWHLHETQHINVCACALSNSHTVNLFTNTFIAKNSYFDKTYINTYMVIFFLLILAKWISLPIFQLRDVRRTNGTPYIVIRYIQLM